MVLDAFTPTNGILTAGGLVALVAGSLILFRMPEGSLALSWGTIAAVAGRKRRPVGFRLLQGPARTTPPAGRWPVGARRTHRDGSPFSQPAGHRLRARRILECPVDRGENPRRCGGPHRGRRSGTTRRGAGRRRTARRPPRRIATGGFDEPIRTYRSVRRHHRPARRNLGDPRDDCRPRRADRTCRHGRADRNGRRDCASDAGCGDPRDARRRRGLALQRGASAEPPTRFLSGVRRGRWSRSAWICGRAGSNGPVPSAAPSYGHRPRHPHAPGARPASHRTSKCASYDAATSGARRIATLVSTFLSRE